MKTTALIGLESRRGTPSNWETWATYDRLTNRQNSCYQWVANEARLAKGAYAHHKEGVQELAGRIPYLVESEFQSQLSLHNSATGGLLQDLLTGAMSRIDYTELAKAIFGDLNY